MCRAPQQAAWRGIIMLIPALSYFLRAGAGSSGLYSGKEFSILFDRCLSVFFCRISPILLQGGPSGRGQPFVDIEIRVAL